MIFPIRILIAFAGINHDEALSSRIAAVNLLDLSLSHLGVEVGHSGPEVEAVVKACGESTFLGLMLHSGD